MCVCGVADQVVLGEQKRDELKKALLALLVEYQRRVSELVAYKCRSAKELLLVREVRVAITVNAGAGESAAALQRSSRQVARAVRQSLADAG